jgi:uncharacterized small protein (TIGR04563 family)
MTDGSGPVHDKRKQSVSLSAAMLEEIAVEAQRLDRSLSWVVQRAWRIARKDIKKLSPDDS